MTSLGWAAEAVRGTLCEVSACTAHPVVEINGRALCARHRDLRRAVQGPACGRCGGTEWVPHPDARDPHAVCTSCECVLYGLGWCG